MMAKKNYTPYILFLILLLAFILRIVNLERADMQGDEAVYSFRAVGYLDILDSEQQTTPAQWFNTIPWWSKFSFHDHPPLVFIIQHLFFKVLGTSTFTARLPFVIFGTLSVLLIFMIGRKIFNEKIGLISAFFLAILNYHIWISRTGYLEGILIFFILLNFYYFIKLLADNTLKNYLWVGVTLGLAFLSKYTMLFLIPVYFFYALIFQKSVLKNKKIFLAIGVFLVTISPVIIYNLLVYITRGHFDLQFAKLLHQDIAKDWPLFAKGQGGLANYFANFKGLTETLINSFGLNYFIFFLLSGLFSFWQVTKKNDQEGKYKLVLIWFGILFFMLQIIFIGPNLRFLPVFTPFFVLIMAAAFFWLFQIIKKNIFKYLLILGFSVLAVFFIIEDIQTNLTVSARTPFNSTLRQENYGYRQLDKYLNKQGYDAQKTLVIFDGRLNWFAKMWYFTRHMYFDGDYNVSIEMFIDKINKEGEDYFQKNMPDLNNFYFIIGKNTLFDSEIKSDASFKFQEFLEKENGLKPVKIQRDDGQTAFEVYNFH